MKLKDKFIITWINDSNRKEVLEKLKSEYWLEYNLQCDEKSIEIRVEDKENHRKGNYANYVDFYKEDDEYKSYTFITAEEFLKNDPVEIGWLAIDDIPETTKKKYLNIKKEKQEVFVNKFLIWEMVFHFSSGKIIETIIKAILEWWFYNLTERFWVKESELFKTKAQLKKSLLKQAEEKYKKEIDNINSL